MLKLHRRPNREADLDAQLEAEVERSPSRPVVTATSVDPERTEDVAAWLRAEGTTSSAHTG